MYNGHKDIGVACYSRFCLYGNDRGNRVWRHRNFRYNEENVTRIRVFHRGSMMIWVGVSFFRTEIVIVPPELNSGRRGNFKSTCASNA